MQPAGLHMGISVDFRNDAPTCFKRRGGSVPLQSAMIKEDSKKLLTFGKEMENYDGSISNLNPNHLGMPDNGGNVTLSPQFRHRHPAQRIGRRCQAGIMGANDQYNDSALVRGYTDQWVPPVGEGAWGVEPTHGGDAMKVGENIRRPPSIGSHFGQGQNENMNPRRIVKAPLSSHMPMRHQSKVGGMRMGGSMSTRRSATPGVSLSKSRIAEDGQRPPRSQSSTAESPNRRARNTGRSAAGAKEGSPFDPRQELFVDSER